MINKLYMFGMPRKIITDQGKEFVNGLNDQIFTMMNIKHAVSSAYHPQTNGQDERTNQNIKRALRKYVNENHNDWDIHLPAVVYGINTAKQSSTRYSPYFLMFHRHPRLPEVINASPMGDDFEVADPEDDINGKVTEMKILNEKVLSNIEAAQRKQQKTFGDRKQKSAKVFAANTGDEVLISHDSKKRRTGDSLGSLHQGPYTVLDVSKGVATLQKGVSSVQKVNISRLRPYKRLTNVPTERTYLRDHCYPQLEWQVEHPYALSGLHWEKDLNPLQDELLHYVLDINRPSNELIVKDGVTCLTHEDFWSLGLSRCMESNIGNACLRIVEEAARKHGKDVYISDLYVVATWKDKHADPQLSLPESIRSKDAILFPSWSRQQDQADHYLLCVECSFETLILAFVGSWFIVLYLFWKYEFQVILVPQREIFFLDSLRPNGFGDDVYKTVFRTIASLIDPNPWTEKTGKDIKNFPRQTGPDSCGIFMLMSDMPLIRRWWCVQLMERFSIEGHGQRFAYWAEEAPLLLKGNLEPLFRVPRSTVGPLQSDGLAESDSTAKNNSNQPRIMRDLKRALCWIHSHTELFAGKVTEPAVMKMSAEDQQNALEALSELENGCEESRDPFTFTFELQEDMETFLCNCADLMGLKVNSMFL
ncbi:uncharacterized protein LOC143510878 isoform X2 [Brachyhypopomus gauderio]|uniref:uncharacterized protein LOC143510878 isoform X2 n=1 Tax=Brachyhypopomus gauderio TaxID=698409 RepID=UPI004042B822